MIYCPNMSTASAEQAKKPRVEVLKTTIRLGTRDWVSHPSGYGFFTVDRARGEVDLIIAYYSFRPGHSGDAAIGESLSNWKHSSLPSRDKKPTEVVVGYVTRMPQTGFTEQWSETVSKGSSIIVDVWRGNNPVEMVFQAA